MRAALGRSKMDVMARSDQLREASNPLYSNRKLRLGTFCSNLSHGCAISKIDGVLKADWPSTLEVSQMGDAFDFDGRFYKIAKGWMQPKPLQKPYPVVMNAGGSDKGREFATKYCDVAFTAVTSHDPELIKQQVLKYRNQAREYGREIQVWTNA